MDKETQAWKETAEQFNRNEQFYHGLLNDCAKHLGPEVYVSDDGSVQDKPLALKVPEMVGRLQAERDMLIYWLLRGYHARLRQGYEEGPTENETFDCICDVLANLNYDAENDAERVKEMLAREPIFYVDEPPAAS